jgi:hypothetical protein
VYLTQFEGEIKGIGKGALAERHTYEEGDRRTTESHRVPLFDFSVPSTDWPCFAAGFHYAHALRGRGVVVEFLLESGGHVAARAQMTLGIRPARHSVVVRAERGAVRMPPLALYVVGALSAPHRQRK